MERDAFKDDYIGRPLRIVSPAAWPYPPYTEAAGLKNQKRVLGLYLEHRNEKRRRYGKLRDEDAASCLRVVALCCTGLR